MQFIQGNNRHQIYFTTADNQVSTDNAVRLIDAFIDKLDLQKVGFTVLFIRVKAARPMRLGYF